MTPGSVEDHLLVECAIWNGRTQLMVAASEGFDPRAQFQAQLEALVAIGLLDAGAVGDWMRRFDRAAEPDEPLRVDQALKERIDRYLESLLPSDPLDEEACGRFETTLHLLEELETMSGEETIGWLEREMPDGPEGLDEDDDDDEEPLRCRELRRVLLGPTEEVGGTRVLSLELYDDGVLVRWTALADDEPAIELSDDVGVAYEFASGGWGRGQGERARGDTGFTPAVPESASRLRLNLKGRDFDLDLGP